MNHNNQQRPQQPQQPASTESRARRTYVLIVSDEHDHSAIEKAAREKFAKRGEAMRCVSELRLARLMDDDEVVIGLRRNVPGSTPETRGKPAAREVVFTEPVPCGEHWNSTFEDGLVIRSSFMEKLATLAVQAGEGVVKEKDGVMRVRYA